MSEQITLDPSYSDESELQASNEYVQISETKALSLAGTISDFTFIKSLNLVADDNRTVVAKLKDFSLHMAKVDSVVRVTIAWYVARVYDSKGNVKFRFSFTETEDFKPVYTIDTSGAAGHASFDLECHHVRFPRADFRHVSVDMYKKMNYIWCSLRGRFKPC